MIKLKKLELSKVIVEKISDRTQRYIAITEAGESIPQSLDSAYKAPEIKELLRCETNDKCAYCESKITHMDYGDVEHILPKSVFPNLRYSYENLTFACGICNTKKGNFYSSETPLINPYQDSPEDHLMAFGPMVLRQPTSDRGLVTEKKLELNRTELVERRQERLEAVAALADQVFRTKSQAIKTILIEQLKHECCEDKEFSFVVSAYVDNLKI